MPELRKDPIVNRWVIISTERGKRPHDFPSPQKRVNSQSCPFCTGNEGLTPPEIQSVRGDSSSPDTPGWSVRVVPNKYPALLNSDDAVTRSGAGDGLFDSMTGFGTHEVIIESPEHDKEFEFLPNPHVADCLQVFQERFLELKKDDRFKYILIFKNHGESAGASIEHSHCQLIGMPIVPELVNEELAGSLRHYENNERCIYCDLIKLELSDGRRIVTQNEEFVALCPYASAFPFEMWILPLNHNARFENTDEDEFPHLASLFKETILRMKTALGTPPYNFYLHTSPIHGNHNGHYHWHIEIMPKLTKVAGFEQGTGFFINPTLPEEAAEILRNTKI